MTWNEINIKYITYIVRKYNMRLWQAFWTCFSMSVIKFYFHWQSLYIVFILQSLKSPKQLSNFTEKSRNKDSNCFKGCSLSRLCYTFTDFSRLPAKPKGTIVLGSVRHIKILSFPDFFFYVLWYIDLIFGMWLYLDELV